MNAASVVYAVAAGAYIAYLVRLRPSFARAGLTLLTIGAALHAVALAQRYVELGMGPVTNSREAFAFFAWAAAIVCIALHARFRLPALGAFVTPLVLAALIPSLLWPGGPREIPEILRSGWLPLHVSAALLAYAAMAAAFVLAVLFLLLERQVKQRRAGGWFQRLPSLEDLDRVNYLCVRVGFALLSIGIITGAVWAKQSFGQFWWWDLRQISSFLTWGLYAALIHARLTAGWRGRRAAILTAACFVVLAGAFVGLGPGQPHYEMRSAG